MTTELSYRNEGANVYAQDGTLVCIAVDPLDAEVLAGLLRWKVDIHPEPTPEPDPWPTAPLIVADWTSGGVEGGRGLLYRETDADQYWTIRENEYPEYTGDTLNNVVSVTVVPVAELEALRASIEALGYETTGMPGSLLDTALRLLSATDMLGVDL